MEIKPGTYTFGPSGGKLFVKTSRAGAAFLVGKNLTIEVTDWEGKLEVGEDPSDTRIELTADGGSLQVTDGEGGPVTLTDLDKKSLSKTVTEDVLDGAEIRFHSDSARPSDDGDCIHVTGELQVFEEQTSLEFQLTIEPEDEDEDEDEDKDKDEDKDEDKDDREGGDDDEREGEDGSAGDDAEDSSEAESEPEGTGSKNDSDDGEDDSSHEDGDDEEDGSEEASGEDDDDDDDDDEADDEDPPTQEHRISGRAVFKQTEVGLEPHSTLLGLLRVRDEVEVTFEGTLEQ